MESSSALTHLFLLIGTSDDYSSNNMWVTPDHENSNNDGTVTTHSVVDGPLFDDNNDPFVLPHSPDIASLSSSSEDGNIDKHAAAFLSVYPKHVKPRGGASSFAVTSKNHYVSQTRSGNVQYGGLTRFVKRAQRQLSGRMDQPIRNAGTGPNMNDTERNDNNRDYREFSFTGTPGLLIEP